MEFHCCTAQSKKHQAVGWKLSGPKACRVAADIPARTRGTTLQQQHVPREFPNAAALTSLTRMAPCGGSPEWRDDGRAMHSWDTSMPDLTPHMRLVEPRGRAHLHRLTGMSQVNALNTPPNVNCPEGFHGLTHPWLGPAIEQPPRLPRPRLNPCKHCQSGPRQISQRGSCALHRVSSPTLTHDLTFLTHAHPRSSQAHPSP